MGRSAEIVRFVNEDMRAALPQLTSQYKKTDIFRMRGLAVQMFAVGESRGRIRGHPTLTVLGSDLCISDLEGKRRKDGSLDRDALLSQVGLEGTSSHAARRWSFPEETPLNGKFAAEILEQLHEDSPVSYVATLEDGAIDKALRWFGKDGYWLAHLFLAYFNMTRGAPSARKDLSRAFDLFIQHSRYSTDKPPFDFEEALHARFLELQARLDRPDCIALCRADAEEHARLLKLPPVVWPPEWPESVPPWPKQEQGLFNKLGRLFKAP